MTTYETRHADKGKALHKALKKAGFTSTKTPVGSGMRVSHNASPQDFAKVRATILEKHPSSSGTNWTAVAQGSSASSAPPSNAPSKNWRDTPSTKSWSTKNAELATALEKRLAKKGFSPVPTMFGDINYLDVPSPGISENEFYKHLEKVQKKLGLA